jgi:homogentisate 1,2-dioxygenase
MPIYHSLGNVPHKRHTVFRRDGALLAEELIGNKGFTGPASLLYHIHQPTPVQAVRKMRDLGWQRDPEPQFRHRHFRTHQLGSGGSLTLDRIPLLFNADVAMSFVQPTHTDEFFYRNAQGDEVIYASQGSGVLETPLGEIPFRDGDYLVIPRGILHRYRFNPGPLKFLVIESTGYVRTPKR